MIREKQPGASAINVAHWDGSTESRDDGHDVVFSTLLQIRSWVSFQFSLTDLSLSLKSRRASVCRPPSNLSWGASSVRGWFRRLVGVNWFRLKSRVLVIWWIKLEFYDSVNANRVTVKWSDKFDSSYSRHREEGLSLSFPLNQERGEFTPSQHSLDGHPPSHFLFDGRMAANNGDEYMTFATNEWCAALGANLLSDSEDIHARLVPCKWCKDPRGRTS